jgi:hypothetical protein
VIEQREAEHDCLGMRNEDWPLDNASHGSVAESTALLQSKHCN